MCEVMYRQEGAVMEVPIAPVMEVPIAPDPMFGPEQWGQEVGLSECGAGGRDRRQSGATADLL